MSAQFLVIFDCDGVLLDSERISVRLDAQMLAELGWPLTEQQVVDRFVGRSHAYMVTEIEAQLGRPLPPTWDAEMGPLYREAFAAELQAVEGVLEALDALDRSGVRMCVASSSSHARLRYTLGLVGLHDRFAGRIFSATDVARGKPAPDLFWHAAQRCGARPADCLVVEDSRWGVEAARAAGMQVIAYAGGLVSAAELAGPGTVVIDSMSDLPKVVLALTRQHRPRLSSGSARGARR